MHLITMAHLGEAQAIIKNFQLKKISSSIYEGPDLIISITGEGPFEAAAQTSFCIGKYQISKVINLGIAGSLNSKLEVGTIYPVRMCYLVNGDKPQFKSYKSLDSGFDCVTSFERITKPEKAQVLKGLGMMVDREAWGVAMAAKNSGIDFSSFKLISDMAGTLGACELVKEDAELWSEKIYLFLLEILKPESVEVKNIHLPDFHFTFTTQHKFKELLKKLSIKLEKSQDEILLALPLEELRKENLSPKERSKKLLIHMEEIVDPIKKILVQELSNWKKPFEDQGITINTDPDWERPTVKISFDFQSNQELENKISVLKSLDVSPLQNLLEGKIDVE